MKYALIIFAVGMGLVTKAVAEDSGLCEDSAKYSCSLGTHDDGTGVVVKDKSEYSTSKQDEALAKESKVLEARIRDYINNPSNSYFRKVAISSLDMNNSPECQSTDSADQKRCTDNVIVGLVDVARRKLVAPLPNPYSYGYAAATPGTSLDLSKLVFVLNNEGFKSIVDQSSKKLLDSTVDPAQLKNVRDKMFPQIRAMLAKKISELPIDEDKKKLMVEKVKGIQFGGTDCSLMAAGISEAYVPNAFYNPASQSFTVCKGFLGSNTSEFNMAMIIGHELAHSIDPCGLATAPEGVGLKYSGQGLAKMESEYPIKGLISCLRSEKSVQASRNPGAPAAYSTVSGTTGATTSSENFCENDQIGEAMADWFGDDIMTEYISANHPNLTKAQWQNGVANVFRPLCIDGGQGFDEHPKLESRVNAMLIVNPKVREKMGCTKAHSKYIHCDAANPEAMALAIAKPAEIKKRVEVILNPPKGQDTQSGQGVK